MAYIALQKVSDWTQSSDLETTITRTWIIFFFNWKWVRAISLFLMSRTSCRTWWQVSVLVPSQPRSQLQLQDGFPSVSHVFPLSLVSPSLSFCSVCEVDVVSGVTGNHSYPCFICNHTLQYACLSWPDYSGTCSGTDTTTLELFPVFKR